MTRDLDKLRARHARALKGIHEGHRPRPWMRDMTLALEIIERQAQEIERLQEEARGREASAWGDGRLAVTLGSGAWKNPYRKAEP